MGRNILYTYNNLEEFNRLYKELDSQDKCLIPFVFVETKELIEEESGLTIDITLMVEEIETNRRDRYPAYVNLADLDESNRVIIRKDIANLALEYLPTVFSNTEPLYSSVEDEIMPLRSGERKILYTYNNAEQLNTLIEHAKTNGIPFWSFTQANKLYNAEAIELMHSENFPIIDVTTMIKAAMSNNAQMLYMFEQFIDLIPNAVIVVNESNANDVVECLPLYFFSYENVEAVYPEVKKSIVLGIKEESLRRITDCNADEIEAFVKFFESKLIGHNAFKQKFFRALKNFVKLNRIKEKRIVSIFLLGNAGLGKTEVARLIKEFLNPETSFSKINFSNYSSQDALNSLIGSPAGYVGCESGELGVKVEKSKAGVVVCDEFEKATRPVFNFFLELLEDGTFTDSLAREYDLDGYIFIFTSNLPNASEFYKIIPAELQSRMDLVCEFIPLSISEKKAYVDFQLQNYMERLSDEFSKHEITDDVVRALSDVNYFDTNDLREIKRRIEQNVIEFLDV